MRKRKAWIVIFLLICIFAIGSIVAYLTDADKKINTATIGGSNITVTEDFDPPDKMKPGDVIPKDVKVKNLGPSSCFVRVKAVFTNEDVLSYCTVDWNTKDWVYNSEDGYYYYKTAIKKNQSTSSLLTKVTISSSAKEEDIKPFDILVYAESYQQGDFAAGDYAAAWKHYQENKPN